jgi:hypothetical protein
MPIIIQRLSDKPVKGKDEYRVCVNNELITTFRHQRSHAGLAQCLRDAADAVDKQRTEDAVKLNQQIIDLDLKW